MPAFTLPSVKSNEELGVAEKGVPEGADDGTVVDAVLENEDLVVIIGSSRHTSFENASIAAISSAKVILSVRTVWYGPRARLDLGCSSVGEWPLNRFSDMCGVLDGETAVRGLSVELLSPSPTL